jgi:hypothetical protein
LLGGERVRVRGYRRWRPFFSVALLAIAGAIVALVVAG